MSKTEVQTDIQVMHIAGDCEFQVHLDKSQITPTARIDIIIELDARDDVKEAWVGPSGYLHVTYDPKGLKGTKRDNFVDKLKVKIADIIEDNLTTTEV